MPLKNTPRPYPNYTFLEYQTQTIEIWCHPKYHAFDIYFEDMQKGLKIFSTKKHSSPKSKCIEDMMEYFGSYTTHNQLH